MSEDRSLSMTIVRTLWWCENCGNRGDLALPARAGVWEGAQAVIDAHAEYPGECSTGPEKIRVEIDELHRSPHHV